MRIVLNQNPDDAATYRTFEVRGVPAAELEDLRGEEPWEPDSHTVEVDGRLEDLAGNNLYGPFDRPQRRTPDRVARKTASVSFEVTG